LFKKLFRKKETIVENVFASNIKENYDLIIHIGAAKTGSSALQKFLLENRKVLEKEGYYYPVHGLDKNGISGGHSNLGLAIIQNDEEKSHNIFETYINEAKKKNCKLLISAESLFNHPEKLKNLVSNYRCKIIAFYRDPLESLFSNYNQGIKRHFQTLDINSVCRNMLKGNNNSLSGLIFEKWCEQFGKENISIVEYDMEFFKKVSIQEIFLNILNISKNRISKIKPKKFIKINKSYNLANLELKRILNFVLDKNNNKLNNELDWLLQELSDKKNEDIKLIDTISTDLKDEIVLKSKNAKEKLKDLNIISFDYLSKENNTKSVKKYLYKNKINDILNIIEYMKHNNENLFTYLVKCINIEISENTNIPYEVQILAQWFDIPCSYIRNESWFTQEQLTNMASGKYKDADFLRDIAILLKDKGDVENAKKIINKAYELRPKGTFIKKNKEEMDKS